MEVRLNQSVVPNSTIKLPHATLPRLLEIVFDSGVTMVRHARFSFFNLALFSWSLLSMNCLDAQTLKTGDRVVFLGDSITQAGAGPKGYVSVFRQVVESKMAGQKIEVLGAGISGNKVPDLQARLQNDVLDKKPDLVVIYIGINDVWHSQNGRGTPRDQYEMGLHELINKIQKTGARVALCTPSVIGEKT